MQRIIYTIWIALFNVLIWAFSTSAQTNVIYTQLVSFNITNGASPDGSLIQASDGNFYGTTRNGGEYGDGTVFQMTPAGTLTTVVSFDGTNGAFPEAPVIQGTDGNLYGTTQGGGSNSPIGGAGTVFSMTTNGMFNYSVSLVGTNGSNLQAGLMQGIDGNFYGVTIDGGNEDPQRGTVFSLTSSGVFTSLHSMSGPGNGPNGGLVQGADGWLYGASLLGGSYGNIYKINTSGVVSNLFTFNNANGSSPTGPLVFGRDGNLYGLTEMGGTYGWGTIFEINTNGTFTNLFTFDGTNGSVQYYGADPDAFARGLILGSDGNFYGETVCGGAAFTGSYYGTGTLFQITTNGVLTTLYSFGSVANDGSYPVGGLIQAADGNFYGVTFQGGTNYDGSIFRLTVPLQPMIQSIVQTNKTLTLTWSAVAYEVYQLQYITNLTCTNWNNLGDSIAATNGIMSLPVSIGSDPQRFYRVVLLQ